MWFNFLIFRSVRFLADSWRIGVLYSNKLDIEYEDYDPSPDGHFIVWHDLSVTRID